MVILSLSFYRGKTEAHKGQETYNMDSILKYTDDINKQINI